jgi:hypothetical protein
MWDLIIMYSPEFTKFLAFSDVRVEFNKWLILVRKVSVLTLHHILKYTCNVYMGYKVLMAVEMLTMIY